MTTNTNRTPMSPTRKGRAPSSRWCRTQRPVFGSRADSASRTILLFQAAFSPSGRLRSHQPRVSTSVSVFVFTDGRRVLHTLLDAGPGVIEAIQAPGLFPGPFPLDWLLLSHGHADHFIALLM